jgi:hypothetical protein
MVKTLKKNTKKNKDKEKYKGWIIFLRDKNRFKLCKY